MVDNETELFAEDQNCTDSIKISPLNQNHRSTTIFPQSIFGVNLRLQPNPKFEKQVRGGARISKHMNQKPTVRLTKNTGDQKCILQCYAFGKETL